MIYHLFKLSSGSDLELIASEEDYVYKVLKDWCCEDCVKESKTLDELLFTSCGAEFMLKEYNSYEEYLEDIK